MDIVAIVKLFSDRPEIALFALVLILVAVGVQRLFIGLVKFLSGHLKSIDENFRSVAHDLNGLRLDVAKVAERLEAREEIVDNKFSDLDRRVTRLESKGE